MQNDETAMLIASIMDAKGFEPGTPREGIARVARCHGIPANEEVLTFVLQIRTVDTHVPLTPASVLMSAGRLAPRAPERAKAGLDPVRSLRRWGNYR